MTIVRNAAAWLVSCVVGLALVHAEPGRAVAGPDQWTDVVAPYIHLAAAASPAAGPLSTVFLIRSTKGQPIQVRVQCFNDAAQFIGPSPQPVTVAPVAHQTLMATVDAPPLNLTSHPAFTGLGWCYFSSEDRFAVDVAWGIYGGPPGTPGFNGAPDATSGRMFSSSASVGVAIAGGQTTVAEGGTLPAGPAVPGIGNVPLYLRGNWFDALVLVNPTASSAEITIDVRNCADCNPAPPPTTLVVPLPPRGMGTVILSDLPGGGDGTATVSTGTTCCFLGWHWAINPTTRQAIFRELTLDRNATRSLGPADRP